MKYFLFNFLWLIAIFPKTLQMPMLFIIAFCLCVENKRIIIKPDAFFYTFFIVGIVNVLSILVFATTREYTLDRLLAAINNCLAIFIACILYLYYKETNVNINRISKAMFRNGTILILLWIVFLLVKEKGNLSFMNGPLCGYDSLGGVDELRFKAYLEYSNLVPYMALYCFPWALYYLKHKYSKLHCIGYICLLYATVLASNSRTGKYFVGALIVCTFVVIYVKKISKIVEKNKTLVFLSIFLIGLLLLAILHSQINDLINNIFSMRQNSSSTRFLLYSVSIQKMIEESPIIGNGVRELFFDIPYGSHSTFISMFYRTGLLGGICFLLGVIISIKDSYVISKKPIQIVCFIVYLCLIAMSLFEDLDGVNWNITMFLITYALLFKNKAIAERLRNE